MTQSEAKVEVETVELKNDTTEPAAEAAPVEALTLDQKLVKQIEYYFGDANLPFDKFIKIESARMEGWFPVTLLLKFNKVINILKEVPEEERVNTIVTALGGSELVDLDESKTKVRRNPDMPLPQGNSDNRTVYLKGFHKSETKLETLIDYFKKYEGMDAVIMRNYKEKVLLAGVPKTTSVPPPVAAVEPATDSAAAEEKSEEAKAEPKPKYEAVTDQVAWIKKFKGSIFVVFKTEEQAKAALADITTYAGNELLKMIQTDYKAMKNKEYLARVEIRISRKRKAGDDGEEKDKDKGKDDETEEPAEEYPKGTLVKVSEIPNGYTREILKEKWYKATDEKKFEIVFADFQRGDAEGVLRLSREGAATEALELLKDGKFQVDENVFVKVEGFDEEAEKAYQVKIQNDRNKAKRHRGSDNRRGGGHRGGGRGRGRGRGRGGRGGRRGRN